MVSSVSQPEVEPSADGRHGVLGRLRSFRADSSGIAALEFALILPVMLVLYLGGIEVTDGLMLKRKVSHTASAIADLVAQDTAIASTAEMQDIFNAGTTILSPYTTSKLKVSVVAISMDASKKATVSWSQTFNGGSCAAKGSVVTVPADLQSANGFLVRVTTEYAYTPDFGYVLTGTIPLKERFYQAPRSGKAITGPSCG
ncbi:Flp pilus assembly protein TadG [Kaistia hirudinis]|uniref:Flp pilus assembly protein TadG n=1 Tax=Kaistia hirudinis TaxID=1293440 RepID=A0A840ATT6_9HYPH|nr:TadE/TadG family type IV pilus assembly protein [Kaistia hirudinis]MBB3932653.1 Flp pilus assembly protein TadG [Kaistia hirudinis]